MLYIICSYFVVCAVLLGISQHFTLLYSKCILLKLLLASYKPLFIYLFSYLLLSNNLQSILFDKC